MAFDKLYQVLEASIEQEGSFHVFSDDLMAAIGNLRDESLKQAQKDSEKKKLEAQRKKEEQEQKEAEPPELEDEANQAKEPALGETELIQIGGAGSTEATLDDKDTSESDESTSGSKGGLLVGVVLLALLAGGWFYLQQQVAFTKTTLEVDCDSIDPSCLACEEGEM